MLREEREFKGGKVKEEKGKSNPRDFLWNKRKTATFWPGHFRLFTRLKLDYCYKTNGIYKRE